MGSGAGQYALPTDKSVQVSAVLKIQQTQTGQTAGACAVCIVNSYVSASGWFMA